MNPNELITAIESKLRGLRSCDTQATAVAWMADAYKLMEAALPHLRDADKPPMSPVIVVVERPKLEIVQTMPRRDFLLKPAPTKTVVYPEIYLHPGSKPVQKAWTHADTLKLENAAKFPVNHALQIQRKGK